MTWKECKTAAMLKLGYAKNGAVDFNDSKNKNVLESMPFAVNEALQYICDTAKPYRKSVQITADGTSKTYLISDLVSDFRSAGANESYLNGIEDITLTVVAEKYLFVPAVTGTIEWFYNAEPEAITDSTADDYELPYDKDVCVILPLYMAAESNKNDDDENLSTVYRNEFEAAVDVLRKRIPGRQSGEFYSLTGWC